MQVADSELCRKLFVLSGWSDPDKNPEVSEYAYTERGEPIPRYDLGYLLRKLPEATYLNKPYEGNLWSCGYNMEFIGEADTPENAVCKLAIELWKQGILRGKEEKRKR